MKKENNLSIITRENLGKHIDNYIRNEKITQSEFAEKIDAELYIDYKPKNTPLTSNKTISRWVRGDVFPDTPNLIAISNILNVSLDELLKEEVNSSSKTKGLSDEERSALNILISVIEEDGTSSVYAPLSFNEENFDFAYFYLRNEVVEFFKEKALNAFHSSRLEDFGNLLKQDNAKIMNKYFSKFMKTIVLEDNITELRERISFDNSDECYKKLQKVWADTKNYDVYNAIVFIEKSYIISNQENKEEFGKESLGKESYYKNITKIKEKYEKSFAKLIEKGIIKPVHDTSFTFEFENGEKETSVSLNAEQFTDFVEIIDDVENEGDYKLRTLKFNFKINLTNSDLKQYEKENLERKFN